MMLNKGRRKEMYNTNGYHEHAEGAQLRQRSKEYFILSIMELLYVHEVVTHFIKYLNI